MVHLEIQHLEQTIPENYLDFSKRIKMRKPPEYMNWRNISAFLAAGIAIFLFAKIILENNDFFVNRSYTALIAGNGKYVTSDLHKGSVIYVDRDRIGHWERFTFRMNPDSSYAVSNYFDDPIVPDGDNFLKAQTGKKGAGARFFMERSGDTVFIRDQQDQFWQISDDYRIRLGPRAQASGFIQVPVAIHIPFHHYLFSTLGILCLVVALVLFQVLKKVRLSILLLVAGSFFLTLYAITMFDFLSVWDEQYHALVAKNLIRHPFKPMLYTDPVLPFDFKNWTGNNIWLHKQPFFLWQMAASISVFGASAWSARIPDLLMMTLMTWMVYRMGSLVADSRTGFWAAFLFAANHFIFRLVTGVQYTDHNDVAFIFYVTASIWSWLEYEQGTSWKRRLMFLVLTGVFAGIAVLIKWLTGLVVFSGWGFYLLINREKRSVARNWGHLFLSVLVCFAVFLPWQLYILLRFPNESMYEFTLSASHFANAIEGHSGDGLGWKYHIERFTALFGISRTWWLFSLIPFLYLVKKRTTGLAFIFMIFLVFLFFSVAATKMPAFTLITISLVFIIFASVFTAFERLLTGLVPASPFRTLLFTSVLLLFFTGMLKLNEKYTSFYFASYDTNSFPYQRGTWAGWFTELAKKVPQAEQSRMVILNCPWEQVVQMMYLTEFRAAYYKVQPEEMNILKSRHDLTIGYLVFPDEQVPEEILNDDAIRKIPVGKGILSTTTGAYR